MSGLERRLCLVTGGTKGIGRATIELFASCKAKVFTCSRNKDELDELLSACTAKGWSVQGCVCDLQDKEALERMVDEVKVCFDGKLHVLVNNAGIVIRKKFFELTEDDYCKTMSTNVDAIYQLCRMCYPMLKASGSGSVVNVGSVAGGPRPTASSVAYTISKGALHQFTRCLSNEWAGEKIRVNCVAPGRVDTPMTHNVPSVENSVEAWIKEAAMRRPGKAEEIAKVIKFFATDDSSFVTGQILYADGGYTVRGLGY